MSIRVVLAAAVVLAAPGAKAADLVVWREQGYNAQEDEAVSEIVAAFEQNTGKQVELVLYSYQEADKALAVDEAIARIKRILSE